MKRIRKYYFELGLGEQEWAIKLHEFVYEHLKQINGSPERKFSIYLDPYIAPFGGETKEQWQKRLIMYNPLMFYLVPYPPVIPSVMTASSGFETSLLQFARSSKATLFSSHPQDAIQRAMSQQYRPAWRVKWQTTPTVIFAQAVPIEGLEDIRGGRKLLDEFAKHLRDSTAVTPPP